MKNVFVLQVRLTHYRMRFFELIKTECFRRGILLHLVYGQPTDNELVRRDEGDLDWAYKVNNFYFQVGAQAAVWQPLPAEVKTADLVVLTQENRIISNYPLLLSSLWARRKVAYWGHGVNFQSDSPNGLREKWKQMMLKRVDWWFAYTQMTREILLTEGYPDLRITVLDNAIDNEAFHAELAAVTEEELASMREVLAVNTAAGQEISLGLFCGSLYPDKRIDFMIAAADRIRLKIPGFSLVVIGDGPSAAEVRTAAQSRPWLHHVGVKKGREKAAWFRLASVVLNPGLVGLHIVDSFCAGVPMVTTSDARHSPEVAYLQSGVNGLVVSGGVAEYGDAVVELLSDPLRFAAMRESALRSAMRYTLENMVQNFCDGIERCLEAEKK